ncbi:MAG TPA: hemolysin family protein [Planctomycetota bacterium]|nr:hemolysin family protein [Planctomycetota bacterium]
MDILYEFVLILLLIVANGLFSMSEMAVVSSRKARLHQRSSRGSAGAAAALSLAENPNSFLSTVQIGITLVAILTGAFGGAGITKFLAEALQPLAGKLAGEVAFAVVIAVITFLSLVIGELVPKRVALSNPEGIASFSARPMQLLARIGSPVVRLLDFSSDIVVKVLRIKPDQEPSVTEDEIKIMVTQAANEGVVARAEQDIVHNVFHFGDLPIRRLMSLRSEVLWLDVNRPAEENWKLIAESPHNYYPVCDGALDRILGIIGVKKLWHLEQSRQRIDLREHITQPLYVPSSTTGLKLLEQFKHSRRHFAIVLDEFGGIQGVVTLNDVLEAIVGEVPEQADAEASMVKRPDGSCLLDGVVAIDVFKQTFNLSALSGEESQSFETMGGFIMHRLGRIPRVADRFESDGFRFEVVDMDGNRVDKILVTPLKK